jgi:shikimate dehydrogenase
LIFPESLLHCLIDFSQISMYSLGLLGYPVLQSPSPLLHSAALRMMGLIGEYRLYPVPPGPDGGQGIYDLIGRMRSGDLHGLNVTIPHKQTVIPYLDELTPIASAIGAVNTIFVKDGRLWGDNTDAPGFMIDLERVAGDLARGPSAISRREFRVPAEKKEEEPPQMALILGAGGSARAVTFALSQAGWRVVVAARRLEQARDLVGDLSRPASEGRWMAQGAAPVLEGLPLLASAMASLKPTPDVIVNTTPLGRSPKVNGCPWPSGVPFPAGAFLYDLIYDPAETVFMRQACLAGLKTANGLGMLVEQAALSLECWTGKPVPRRAMWQAVPEPFDTRSAIHYSASPSWSLT